MIKIKTVFNKKLFFPTSGFIFLSFALFGCIDKVDDHAFVNCTENLDLCKNKIVELNTSKGIISVELDFKNAPLTSRNFLSLVNNGVYNKTTFHRVIKSPVPFLVQGGDPLSKDLNKSKYKFGTGSYLNPETGQIQYIPLEIKLNDESLPRYNQLINNPSELSKIVLIHDRGSLSMARGNKLNSASSQFYISLKLLPELDGRYAVFGRVVRGINIVESIDEGDYIYKANEVK